MREITDHRVEGNELNQAIQIVVIDEPGQGGACHHYNVTLIDGKEPPVAIGLAEIKFQNGPVKEFGLNGISQEALLAIVIDRLRSFQAGPYACHDNAVALDHCEWAMKFLQKRTRERMARGVEGTNQK